MAEPDLTVVYTRTQKPGKSDWIVMWPAGDQVTTARVSDIGEIEPMIRRHLEELYPEMRLEFVERLIPYESLFGPNA